MLKRFLFLMVLAAAALPAWSQTRFEGYLSDVLCGEAGFPEGYESIDLRANPERHPVACLTMDNCSATGFGLFLRGQGNRFVFHPFDGAANQLFRREILPKLTEGRNPAPLLRVQGRVSAAGRLQSISRMELLPQNAPRPQAPQGGGMSGHNM